MECWFYISLFSIIFSIFNWPSMCIVYLKPRNPVFERGHMCKWRPGCLTQLEQKPFLWDSKSNNAPLLFDLFLDSCSLKRISPTKSWVFCLPRARCWHVASHRRRHRSASECSRVLFSSEHLLEIQKSPLAPCKGSIQDWDVCMGGRICRASFLGQSDWEHNPGPSEDWDWCALHWFQVSFSFSSIEVEIMIPPHREVDEGHEGPHLIFTNMGDGENPAFFCYSQVGRVDQGDGQVINLGARECWL